ncbi:hypothetical protein FOA52_001474 [Chlamydomonas sp. UWO 241]|nr:hypothetical protein FOA52_001474 [Chlamydomonas sp. UWO 241]
MSESQIARGRLLARGVLQVASFTNDVLQFLDAVGTSTTGGAPSSSWESEREAEEVARGSRSSHGVAAIVPRPEDLAARAQAVFEQMHGDLEVMLKELLALDGRGQGSSQSERARPGLGTTTTWLDASVDGYLLDPKDLDALGIDLSNEASATTAAAQRLRSQANQASGAAARLRGQAWAKEAESAEAAVQAA